MDAGACDPKHQVYCLSLSGFLQLHFVVVVVVVIVGFSPLLTLVFWTPFQNSQ